MFLVRYQPYKTESFHGYLDFTLSLSNLDCLAIENLIIKTTFLARVVPHFHTKTGVGVENDYRSVQIMNKNKVMCLSSTVVLSIMISR